MPDPATATSGWHRWIRPLRSVRVRITLAAVLVTTLAVGVAGWLLVRSVEDAQIRELRDDINANLDQVATRLEEGDDPQEAVEAVEAAGATPLLGSVQVRDESGQIVASSPTSASGADSLPVNGQGDEPPPSGAGMSVAVDTGSGRTIRLETVARTVDTPTGQLTVTGAVPVDQMAGTVDALRRALVIGLPALVALVAVIAFVLVGRALRPVEAIRAEADAITGSTIHRRVPEPPTGDEIGRLARTMNAMLDRLDAAATRQRQFVSDASHELRSPVAAIRTGLEVARRRSDTANWAAVADTALAEEARLETLLDDLLLLAARDENGATAARGKPVDLTTLTTAEARRPRRVPVGVVHWPTDDEAIVMVGAEEELTRALSNLVDNAARYATSAVQITLSSYDGTVSVIVDDDGPGIPADDRERVFERFTRLDDSRARHKGGSGLGLAVVRSVVTRHHGRIRVDDSPLGGARFVAEFPTGSTAPTT
jgi:signal transduction histidine kinase